jgi:hypothetical protein
LGIEESIALSIMSSTAIEDKGYVVKDLNICLIVFSTLFALIRCYVRGFMLKSLSWDDAFAGVAWVSFPQSLSCNAAPDGIRGFCSCNQF